MLITTWFRVQIPVDPLPPWISLVNVVATEGDDPSSNLGGGIKSMITLEIYVYGFVTGMIPWDNKIVLGLAVFDLIALSELSPGDTFSVKTP